MSGHDPVDLAQETHLRVIGALQVRGSMRADPCPNVPAFDHGENRSAWGGRGPCNCKPTLASIALEPDQE